MKSLSALHQTHQGKVSDKWAVYLPSYDAILTPYREQAVNVLEIGIQNGGSLEVWSQFFPQARAIIGCDINEKCRDLHYDDPRIKLVITDANSDAAQSAILSHASALDIIIDDGSHVSSDIVRSFARYFPHLTEGGVFIAEDLHCSYWLDFEGGVYDPYSSIAFFKRLVDVINQEHLGVDKSAAQLMAGFCQRYGIELDDTLLATIHSVEFINSVCVIRKQAAAANRLGARHVSGTRAQVTPDPLAQNGTFLVPPAQHHNRWSTLEQAPDEQWSALNMRCMQLENKLRQQEQQAQARIAELELQRNRFAAEVEMFRQSSSWRLTKPVRLCGDSARLSLRVARQTKQVIDQQGTAFVLRKAWGILRKEGLAGVRYRLATAPAPELPYAAWVARYDTPDESTLAQMRQASLHMEQPPLISVVMPTYNTRLDWLDDAIQSVLNQAYPHWELCIADDASPKAEVKEALKRYQAQDSRIKVVFREQNGHISEATNSALELVSGDWVALFDHDDILSPTALYHMACAIKAQPAGRIFYSDEDKVNDAGQRYDPHFKCGWNPDLLHAQNYISHLGVYCSRIIRKAGGFRKGVEGSQDYDLLLRCLLQLDDDHQVVHIPRVLYHWRAGEGSTARDAGQKSYTSEAGKRALEDYFAQRGQPVSVTHGTLPNMYRVTYPLPAALPLVSLVIPTRDCLALLEACVTSILTLTTYKHYEILIVDNGSVEQETLHYFTEIQRQHPNVRVLRYDQPFNYSAINNFAVRQANGTIIGLINNDIEVISPEWLGEMVSHAIRDEIGCVGAKLYYGNDTIQHAAVILGLGGVAGHSHKDAPRTSPGYFGRMQAIHSVSAVTAACLLVRKDIYWQVGGLEEEKLSVAFNDVDFCLKVREAGYRNLWTPYAELYHHESVSRGQEDTPEKKARFAAEVDYMLEKWSVQLQADPYYSPNLTLQTANGYTIAFPPRVEGICLS